MIWLRRRLGLLADETGSALVEFVFIALVVFVPLIYIVAGFSAVQRGVFASTAAARSARSCPVAASGAVAIARPASRAAAVEAKMPRCTAENPATM